MLKFGVKKYSGNIRDKKQEKFGKKREKFGKKKRKKFGNIFSRRFHSHSLLFPFNFLPTPFPSPSGRLPSLSFPNFSLPDFQPCIGSFAESENNKFLYCNLVLFTIT